MRRLFPLGLVLALAPAPALAAGFAIDPDPRSPSLGEILDAEKRAKPPPRAELAPARISTKPVVPQGAVTVVVPRARLR